MDPRDTNREEIALDFLKRAHKALHVLQCFATEVDKALQECTDNKRPLGAFPIAYIEMLREKVDVMMCEISRCNGALLVRTKKKKAAA